MLVLTSSIISAGAKRALMLAERARGCVDMVSGHLGDAVLLRDKYAVINTRDPFDAAFECLGSEPGSEMKGDREAIEVVSRAFYLGDPDWPQDLRLQMASEYARSVAMYWELRGRGLSREDARYILPQAIVTKVVVTMNAREILHFLGLRMCTHAQTEIRLVAWMLREELMKIHPRLFKYAAPYCILDNNLVSKEPTTLEDIVEGRAQPSIERCRELVPREGIRNCVLHSMKLYRTTHEG